MKYKGILFKCVYDTKMAHIPVEKHIWKGHLYTFGHEDPVSLLLGNIPQSPMYHSFFVQVLLQNASALSYSLLHNL
jgi:hypothetical protein